MAKLSVCRSGSGQSSGRPDQNRRLRAKQGSSVRREEEMIHKGVQIGIGQASSSWSGDKVHDL